MKKFALALLCLVATLGVSHAQTTEPTDTPTNGAKIRFTEMEHQYGTIAKGSDGTCEFEFVNEGNEPLILSQVKASCGCTTPSYTQKPIMPGEKGTIKVSYNTNNVGAFSKSITVTSNAINEPRVVLRIKGNVQGDKNTSKVQQSNPAIKADEAKLDAMRRPEGPQPAQAK